MFDWCTSFSAFTSILILNSSILLWLKINFPKNILFLQINYHIILQINIDLI